MIRTLRDVDCDIAKLQETIDTLQGERGNLILQAHVVTAADFRIKIERDDCDYDFEDIVGDGADEAERNDPESFYYKAYQAYHVRGGDGVYAWGIVIERLDPVTGEFEQDESCWGYFSLSNWPDADTMSSMMEFAAGCLPDGVNIADVEGAL